MNKENYYQNRKDELNKEYQQLVFETCEDIERAIIKKLKKSGQLEEKLKELEAKEKGEKKDETTTAPAPESPANGIVEGEKGTKKP